ncbi:MAG TPA: hypothetical protein VFR89_04475, partial [candidate division Zixibacteria bacterium]|nr:hypothetical protein [candidate division Zixibacteria bacterium]
MKAPPSAIPVRGLLFGFLLAFALGCATTGPGGKKSLIFIGSGTEVSMGKEAEKEVLSQSKVLADSAWQSYVARVGHSLA